MIADTRAALTFKLAHDDLSKYNYVQKLLYAGIIVVGILIVLSGLSMWKPVQLYWLSALFGGYDVARYVHFTCMAVIVAFVVVHVALAVLVPKSLRAMIIGRERGQIMGRMRNLLIPGVDKKLLVLDAVKTMPDFTRRRFITAGASLGALTLLTGCDVSDSFSAEEMLKRISKFNDGVQAAIFNPNAMAPTFSESDITKPFPFNAYYDIDDAPEVDGKTWKLEVRGLVDNKKPWTLEELYKLPQVKQITRHICVEGWSAIGSWTGTPLRDFLKLIGADTRARYVWFQCADKDGYNSPLDMATALHPQTQMTFKFADEILPRAYGFPMKIRVPTKLGFKNPKYVLSMEVTNDYKGGYWEDQGYNSFSGS